MESISYKMLRPIRFSIRPQSEIQEQTQEQLNLIYTAEPKEYQIPIIEKAIKEKQHCLFLEMGLGKTFIMIQTIANLKRLNKINKAIVIAPKSLLYVWGEEIEKFSRLSYSIVTGTKRQKEKALKQDKDIYLMNYESLLQDLPHQRYNLIILDESQKIKNHQAKRTRKLLNKTGLFRNVEYRYILTGTPLTNNPLDFWSQINFVKTDYLGRSFYGFRNHYAIMGGYMKYEVIGYKDLEELENKVSKVATILKKKDVLKLPEKIYEKRLLDMPTEIKKQYKEMRDNFLIEFNGDTITAPVVLTKLLRFSEITAGHYLTDQKNNEKLKELISIVKDTGTKIVIWANFIKSIKIIEEGLKDNGFNVRSIYGDVPIEERQEIVNQFQNGDLKIVIVQLRTGSTGLTLTKGETVIYYENSFDLADRMQSEDRTHRIGTKNSPVYIDLMYNRTIDSKIQNALRDKKNITSNIINNIKDLI